MPTGSGRLDRLRPISGGPRPPRIRAPAPGRSGDGARRGGRPSPRDRTSASARAAMAPPRRRPPRDRCSSSSTSCGIAATASRTTATISGERASVWLMTRFSRLSTLQENSPTRRAPTMRPLPFSVWNARRRSRSALDVERVLLPLREQLPQLRGCSRALPRRTAATNSGSTASPASRQEPRGRARSSATAVLPRQGAALRRRGALLAPRRRLVAPPVACRAQRDDPLRRRARASPRQRLGVLEHVPRVRRARPAASPCSTRPRRSRRRAGRAAAGRARSASGRTIARERATDALHHLDGALLAEHQQAGRDAAHQLRHLVEALRLVGAAERLRDRLLDARHVDDALAQHRVLDVPEFLVGRLAGCARHPGRVGQDQPHELRVEAVLDLDQRRGDAEQRRVVRRLAPLDDAPSAMSISPCTRSRSAPRPSTPSVSLILRSISSCGTSSSTCVRARAHEDVEHVLDAGQVLADRRRDRLHQPHARRRQRLARLRRLGRPPPAPRRAGTSGARRATRGPCDGRARDVEEQVVQQLDAAGRRRSAARPAPAGASARGRRGRAAA